MEIATTTMAGPTEALVKFCLLWSVLHRNKPPEVCNKVLNSMENYHSADLDKVFFSQNGILKKIQNYPSMHGNSEDVLSPEVERDLHDNAFQFHFKHSSRSLSVIG